MDWRGASIDGLATLLEVLLDKPLFVVLVNDRLTIGDKGSHFEDDGSGGAEELDSEKCTTADGARPCKRDERRRGTGSGGGEVGVMEESESKGVAVGTGRSKQRGRVKCLLSDLIMSVSYTHLTLPTTPYV